MGWVNAAAMTPYNNYWKTVRKNITQVTGSNVSVGMFDKVQETEAAHFLLNLLSSPQDLFEHIRKEAGAVILKITYGYTAEPHGRDPFVDLAGATMGTFAEATVPGRWMVDMMPFFKYLPEGCPGTGWKDVGRKMHNTLKQ